MSEIVDEVVSNGPAERRGRTVVSEAIDAGGNAARVDQDGIQQEEIHDGRSNSRAFKESTVKLLDKLNTPAPSGDTVSDASVDPDDTDAVSAATAQADGNAESVQETKVATTEETVKEGGEEVETLKSEIARLAEQNRKFVQELETVKKAPKGELSAREKALDEVERLYLDDNITAIRKLMATALGVDDPNHKDVDAELSGLYVDLTARELNVPLEASHRAARDAARARQLLARDKRERKAEEDAKASRASTDDETRVANEAATFISNRLSSKGADGKSLADNHPLLTTLSKDLDGMEPGHLVWRVIQRELQAGNLNQSMSHDQWIEAASKIVEDHYRSISEKFSKFNKPKDAAQPATASANATASTDNASSTAKRTITNATASVAPATPAKQITTATTEERPKFRNDRERRKYILDKHFGKEG